MTWFPRGTEKRVLACQDLLGCGGVILLALPFENKPVWRLSHAGSNFRESEELCPGGILKLHLEISNPFPIAL